MSRTEDPAASRELLNVLDLVQCFHHLEIFPSKKFAHFEKYVKLITLLIPEIRNLPAHDTVSEGILVWIIKICYSLMMNGGIFVTFPLLVRQL